MRRTALPFCHHKRPPATKQANAAPRAKVATGDANVAPIPAQVISLIWFNTKPTRSDPAEKKKVAPPLVNPNVSMSLSVSGYSFTLRLPTFGLMLVVFRRALVVDATAAGGVGPMSLVGPTAPGDVGAELPEAPAGMPLATEICLRAEAHK